MMEVSRSVGTANYGLDRIRLVHIDMSTSLALSEYPYKSFGTRLLLFTKLSICI